MKLRNEWQSGTWRPKLMQLFGFILVHQFVIAPWLDALFGLNPTTNLPEGFWWLLGGIAGAYVAGRTGEKIKGRAEAIGGGDG